MSVLIAGLVLFLGVHLVPAFAGGRAALVQRWGEQRYKGMFTLISFAGLALIIAGYAIATPGPQLFASRHAPVRKLSRLRRDRFRFGGAAARR